MGETSRTFHLKALQPRQAEATLPDDPRPHVQRAMDCGASCCTPFGGNWSNVTLDPSTARALVKISIFNANIPYLARCLTIDPVYLFRV